VVPELIMSMEGDKIDGGDNSEGDYVNLRDENGAGERCNLCGFYWGFGWSVFWYWVKLALLFTFIGLLAAACVMWVGPFLMDKVSFYKKSFVLFVVSILFVLWNLVDRDLLAIELYVAAFSYIDWWLFMTRLIFI